MKARTHELEILPNTMDKFSEMQHPRDSTPPSEVPCSEQRSKTSCTEMFRDFPNSLENSRICNKVKEKGKKEDWILRQQAACDRSRKFSARFLAECCGEPWCRFAGRQAARWEEEANSVKCREDTFSDSRTRLRCRTMKNSLKALKVLQCNGNGM